MRTLLLLWLCACGRIGFDSVRDDGGLPDAFIPAVGCTPIPVGTGRLVSNAADLRVAIAEASPGDTLLLADGVYAVASSISVTTPITIRSASNNAAAVILDGGGTAAPVLDIHASNTQLFAFTIRNAGDGAVIVEAPSTGSIGNITIYGMEFVDNTSVGVRVRPYATSASGPFVDTGTIACSRFVHTTPSSCGADGVFGIRIVGSRDWVIDENYFSGQCSPVRTRAVWVDRGSRDVRVINNEFANNMNNIMFGGMFLRMYPDPLPLGCTSAPDTWGGLVCNNRIYGLGVPPRAGEADFEEGIALWSACDTRVLHNTVISPGGAETFSEIEYRFAPAYVHLLNNLVGTTPLERDSGRIDPDSNTVIHGGTATFVDAPNGDLHISETAPLGTGLPIDECTRDADDRMRVVNDPTPGAYER